MLFLGKHLCCIDLRDDFLSIKNYLTSARDYMLHIYFLSSSKNISDIFFFYVFDFIYKKIYKNNTKIIRRIYRKIGNKIVYLY